MVAVTQSLLTAYMVEFTHKQSQFWMQTDEGAKYARDGTPEFQVRYSCFLLIRQVVRTLP